MFRIMLLIGAPALMGLYCILLSPSLPRALLTALAIFLSAVATVSKRAAYITAAAFTCAINYLTTIPIGEQKLRLWGSLLFGLVLFLYVELGNDVLRVSPQEIKVKTYRLRFVYLSIAAIGAVVGCLIVLTLAYNFAVYLPGIITLRLILIGLLVIVLGLGAVTMYQIRKPD